MTFLEDALLQTATHLFTPDGVVVPLGDLLELGLDQIVVEHPSESIRVLAEVEGKHRASSRLIEWVMARRLGIEPSNEALGFALGGPSLSTGPIDILVLSGSSPLMTVVAPVEDGSMLLQRLPAADLQQTPVTALDTTARWTRLQGSADPISTTVLTHDVWIDALAMARLALTHEFIGVVSTMLELAVTHVTDRHQFGVPLGTFQAVQHRLADVFVQLESARSISRTGWIDHDPSICAAALLAATRAFESASEHCQQVMGAIGCTWEHALHRFIRRGLLLQLLLRVDTRCEQSIIAAAMSDQRSELFT